jgi:hypothetical protein
MLCLAERKCVVVLRLQTQSGGALVAAAPLQLCCKKAATSCQRLVTTDVLLETHHNPLLEALQQVSAMEGEGELLLVLAIWRDA